MGFYIEINPIDNSLRIMRFILCPLPAEFTAEDGSFLHKGLRFRPVCAVQKFVQHMGKGLLVGGSHPVLPQKAQQQRK